VPVRHPSASPLKSSIAIRTASIDALSALIGIDAVHISEYADSDKLLAETLSVAN
jgi:hypothetical protein